MMSEYSGCDDFEPLMKSYKETKTEIKSGTFNGVKLEEPYQYICPEGFAEASTVTSLMWEVFKHRCYHLWNHGKWMD